MSYVAIDRKQIFGSAELDENYMDKIKELFDNVVRELTREGRSV